MIDLEKIRPVTISKIIGNKSIVKTLSCFLKEEKFPNLLFEGDPGIGKTTSALAFSKEFLGKDFKTNFIELNASNNRGIEVIRNLIKDFIKHRGFSNNLKIILFDEADYLTNEAQSSLRRVMEKYYGHIRFIFTVNNSKKIIPAIKSRVLSLKFKKPEVPEILNFIASLPVNISEKNAMTIINHCNGDLRKIITTLSSKSFMDTLKIERDVYKELVLCFFKEPLKINYSTIQKFIEEINGFDIDKFVKIFYDELIILEEYSKLLKIKILYFLSIMEWRIKEGLNYEPLLYKLFYEIYTLKNTINP